MAEPLPMLRGEQALASSPTDQVWLSASAGTGKTHVLSSRVFRLLLNDVPPENILCLTFTKAGAAEMANRIQDRLAAWVQMDEKALFRDLEALGEDSGPEARDHARRLFARVLETTGGGLRIQTIHSFCQQLLGSFPLEAGLVPGFRPLDERQQTDISRETLASLLVEAEATGDIRLIEALQALSIRLGEGETEGFLKRCGANADAMEMLPDDLRDWLFELLGLPSGDIDCAIADACHDHAFDMEGLNRIIAANEAWGSATGRGHAEIGIRWHAGDAAVRAATLHELITIPFTAKGEPRSYSAKLIAAEPDYAEIAVSIGDRCTELIALKAQVAYAHLLVEALYAGKAYARAYVEAKRRAGAVDFDDLIARAVGLLRDSSMAAWIAYKLDQRTDHILVDEGQDTNVRQWIIVRSLVSEFFAYAPEPYEKVRTLFTVGDFKQAIFGFQGTSPVAFRAAQKHFADSFLAAERELNLLSLDRSFRSTPAVLEAVDATMAALGSEALGLEPQTIAHASARPYPGTVSLLAPVTTETEADDEDEAGEESWLGDHVRRFATKLAAQIGQWLRDGLMLESQGRPIRPGDIMILVRSRKDLARLIVARLYEEGVPVAGIDRLRLSDPLAVRDLLAALRFVLQPGDDLNLANLLVSPLIGWSQDDLMHRAPRQNRLSLWAHIGGTVERALLDPLYDLLNRADFMTPYAFLEHILSGPMQGRRRLMARLGEEARDPVEELLNQALAFELEEHPSLQRFVDWFDRGVVDVKRESGEHSDAVRVLTVHGSKGLQAPMVILADATHDPSAGNRGGALKLTIEDGVEIPVINPSKGEGVGLIAEAQESAARADLEEHWRLLYVALTRAEEHLIIGGALGPRAKGQAPEQSWYAKTVLGLEALGADIEADPIWSSRRVWRGREALPPKPAKPQDVVTPDMAAAEPVWLRTFAPAEARPPRPLAPSAQPDDLTPDPPPLPALRGAAERGRLLHALFERLPTLPSEQRQAAAERWLARQGGDPAIAADALAVIADPRFAEIFAPDALAEAPIAAIVGETVVAGTVDRLCVGGNRVLVVDFKTGSRVPVDAESAPTAHLRQMAAYVAALEVVFPGRRVEAALLYTSAPRLIALPDWIIARNKPGFLPTQDNL